MEKNSKFIIVDDDPINNKLCRHIIKSTVKEADITDFTFPSKAVEYIKTPEAYGSGENPVILLLDLNMPMISGWDFLELFSEMEHAIRKKYRIFILSSSIDARDVVRADENEHVCGYLSKPLTKDKIKSIFDKIENVQRKEAG